jgi:Na+-translocating ferredoxin:NAD+ oxidoreductase RnfD subunit
MVFILFMLTDPKTTPKHKMQQILFSFMVAAVATLFDYLYGFRVQHLFMSLFLVSPIVPILEQKTRNRDFILLTIVILLLALSAIIYIENQPPYYYEMVR